jgi:hypothetical protein
MLLHEACVCISTSCESSDFIVDRLDLVLGRSDERPNRRGFTVVRGVVRAETMPATVR